MSDKVSLSKASNPDQFTMRVVIEEDSFRQDKEKLRYSAEELDEILRRFIEDIAKKPEECLSFGSFSIGKIDSVKPPLYIWFTSDADSVRLFQIKEK